MAAQTESTTWHYFTSCVR